MEKFRFAFYCNGMFMEFNNGEYYQERLIYIKCGLECAICAYNKTFALVEYRQQYI